MKYFISAGEASGDLHASQLISSLRKVDFEASFVFLGGDMMAAKAGGEPIVHYRDMAYMGFVDVAINLRKVLGNLSKAKSMLEKSRPDCLILVDYPSFNLRLAGHAMKLGIPVYYFISPKVWAWKEYRVKTIRKLVRRMFSILPFEVGFYHRHNYEVDYVGNPTVNEIDKMLDTLPQRDEFTRNYGLDTSKPIIALLPGSRVSEIKTNLKLMVDAASRFSTHMPVIAAAPSIDASLYDSIAPGVRRISGATHQLVAMADAALVTSGTATLETAVIGTPQIVTYRAVGSKLVYNLFKHILKVKYVSLPNLIMDDNIVPELLLHQCTSDNISAQLSRIVSGGSGRTEMLDGYKELRRRLGNNNAADTTARIIYDDMKK